MPVIYTRVKSPEVFKDVPQLKAQQSRESWDMKKLEHYEKLSKIKSFLFNPLKMFMEKPGRTFFITVPISIIYLFFNTRAYISVENHFLMAILFVITPFTVFFEFRTRQDKKI